MIQFDGMDETDFEEFCFELLPTLGFVNVDWRKGTGKTTSPADRGRDLVAELKRIDIDGAHITETWFVDCKHQKSGVSPDRLQNLLAWANADRPDVALFVVSNFLSNPAKDFLGSYATNNRPPFRIKVWERPQLHRLLLGNDDLLRRYALDEGMRQLADIVSAEQEFFDRVWHERHLVFMNRVEQGKEDRPPEVVQMAREAAERVRARYADTDSPIRPVTDDFEWGMWNGKLSALRWVLGDEWDFLDT